MNREPKLAHIFAKKFDMFSTIENMKIDREPVLKAASTSYKTLGGPVSPRGITLFHLVSSYFISSSVEDNPAENEKRC